MVERPFDKRKTMIRFHLGLKNFQHFVLIDLTTEAENSIRQENGETTSLPPWER
jgi:hypothetical protein